MKEVLTVLVVLSLGTWPGLAYANEAKSQFYEFGDQLVDGVVKRPAVVISDVRKRAHFELMTNLKKSFKPALLQTSKERVFK